MRVAITGGTGFVGRNIARLLTSENHVPIFAFVGFKDKSIRPAAVEDVARIVKASVVEGALGRKTLAVLGPEKLTLREAVGRVARVAGRKPLTFAMPIWFHYLLSGCLERMMKAPMVSVAQVRMLSEGLAEPATPCDPMPAILAPNICFTEAQIRKGLPAPGPFTWRDLQCCPWGQKRRHFKRVFFEMP